MKEKKSTYNLNKAIRKLNKRRNMKEKKSTYNLIASLVYKIGTCVIGLLIPRLFVLSYGSEINGLQSSISQIFAYISLIEAGVGEATLQALFGPVSRKDRDVSNSILSATTYYYNFIGVIYYRIAHKKYPWVNFHVKPNKAAISQKNSVLIHKIAGIVFQNTDIIILTIFCGLKVVSIYTMYKFVINMVTTIIASFADSFNFIFGQTYNGDNQSKYGEVIDTFNVFYSAMAFGLFTVTNIMILPFLKLYTSGMDINYIYPILPYLYIAIEVLQVGREAMLRTITVAGHFKKTLYAAITEMVINLSTSIVAVIVLKNYFGDIAGLYGVLLGTVVALLYRTIDINRYANHKILNRSSLKTNKIMITNIAVYCAVMLVVRKLNVYIGNYLSFIVYGVLFSIGVLSVFLLVQGLLNKEETRHFIRFIRKKAVL